MWVLTFGNISGAFGSLFCFKQALVKFIYLVRILSLIGGVLLVLRIFFTSSSLFALVLFGCGVSLFFDRSFIGGTGLILIALFLSTPVRFYVYGRTGIRFNRLQRLGILLLIFLVTVAVGVTFNK